MAHMSTHTTGTAVNEDIQVNDAHNVCNESSFGLIGDLRAIDGDNTSHLLANTSVQMDLTPTLESRADISKRHHLFGFNRQKTLFSNHGIASQMDTNFVNNSLGLSPVKNPFANTDHSFAVDISTEKYNESNAFDHYFNGIQVNSFGSNDMSHAIASQTCDEDFKSISKCSDFELKAEQPMVDINQTYRSPNSDFGDENMSSYFKHRSEPLSAIPSFGESMELLGEEIMFKSISNELSVINSSFVSINDEISSSNNTLENVQKILDRKNRKRKSLVTNRSTLSQCNSFAPSVNSTLNLCDNMSASYVHKSSKSVVTSGLGTLSTVQTYSPNSESSQSIGLMTANTLSLNQMLVFSPNVLSLTIGCFVEFKLNYLKVKNLSITSFKTELKINANVDTLNALHIKYPKHMINIPAFFDGLFSEDITITPLKCGSFTIVFQIYPSIENINLPISPLSVICRIRSEEVVIKRPLFSSNYCQIHYNLFEEKVEKQTIDLCVNNKNISDVIPLKLCLEANKGFLFEPLYRHSDSTIHTFRCLDPQTLFVVTKTQYEIRIPLIIVSNGNRDIESCLTVSTDSPSSHVLAIFQLRATFWPKKPLEEHLLQCSQTSVSVRRGEWETINFRNKSHDSLIRVHLESVCGKSIAQNVIRFSSNQVMIGPSEKVSIALMVHKKTVIKNENQLQISVVYDMGSDKSKPVLIPVQII